MSVSSATIKYPNKHYPAHTRKHISPNELHVSSRVAMWILKLTFKSRAYKLYI